MSGCARKAARVVAIVTLSGSLVAACGGNGEERLTTEQFRTRANAICVDIIGRAVSGRGVSAIPGLVDDLVELAPPEEVEADVQAYFDEMRSAVDTAVEQSQWQTLVAVDPYEAFEEANRRAQALGLTDCRVESPDS